MKRNTFQLLIIFPILLIAGLGCANLGNSSNSNQKPVSESKPAIESKPANDGKPAKLDSYSLKGIKFAYYRIPSGLKESELIDVAQKIHDQESDTQLVLVDDDTELADYVKYVKAISGQGEIEKPLPAEWAEKHIIANVQKYMSGKFVLCKSNGSEEITDLK